MPENPKIRCGETKYGFQYGSLLVERLSDNLRGRGEVVVSLSSGKHTVQVYGTKTGRMRVWQDGKEMEVGNE